MQNFRSFTEGSITRGLINFALPVLFADVLQSLNASVNSIWVGRYLGEAALAVTSNANAVMFLPMGATFGIAMAATILVGQCIGASNIRGAKRVVGTSATVFGAISVGISVAGLTLSEPGFGPIARMGIAGSALATVVAQSVLPRSSSTSTGTGTPLCLHKNELSMLRVEWAIVSTLLRKGIPMSGDILVPSLSCVLMITLVNRFGVDTTAAFGASIQLWNYLPKLAAAVAMAASTMATLNVGAQQWDRVKSIARVGVVCSVLGTSFTALTAEILDTHVFENFVSAGSQALHIASHINRVATWSCVFSAVSMVLLGVTRAAGAVMVPFLIATLSILVVQFSLAETLLDRWQADATWWSFPISSVLDVVLAVLYYKYGGWRTAWLQFPAHVKG